LRDLAALNTKLLVDFSCVVSLKMQSQESVQLKEYSMDLRQRSMGTVGQLRDVLEFIFFMLDHNAYNFIFIILYVIIDYFIIPLNDLAFAIAHYSFSIAFMEGR
jgi:hypothetical protein